MKWRSDMVEEHATNEDIDGDGDFGAIGRSAFWICDG
jgi:hypothetical protein